MFRNQFRFFNKQKTSQLGGFGLYLLEITATKLMDFLNKFLKSVRIEHL